MFIVFDIILKVLLVGMFFVTLGHSISSFDPIGTIKCLLILLYLYLLRNSLNHLKVSSFKSKLAGYTHTFFPPLAIFVAGFSPPSRVGEGLLIVGTATVFVSLLKLWGGFSIVAFQSRKIEKTGMYSIVRHPIYLGHVLVFSSILTASFEMLTIIVFTAYFALTLYRISAEETVLLENDEYLKYKNKIPFKIIPFLV
jgi:protein-S-isoprenylcysteine O-methyltransferase Ste14